MIRHYSKLSVVNTALGFPRRIFSVEFSGSAPKRIHTASFGYAGSTF